jgi:hypothetical protein
MSESRKRELTQLGLWGLAPFIVSFVGVWLSPWIVSYQFADGLRALALFYGAIIVSYLAGFGGGGILAKSPGTAEPLLPGMIAALAAWLALLPADAFGINLRDYLRYFLVIGALAFLLLRDLRAVADGLLPAWFGELRIRLTFWAVISLMMIMARALI